MLMLIYRIAADAAFELLKWRSQETNVQRALAQQLSADFLALPDSETLPTRTASIVWNHLLMEPPMEPQNPEDRIVGS